MARKAKPSNSDKQRPGSRARTGAPFKRKSCNLCKNHAVEVDYKDVSLLRRYLSDRAKIRSRRMTGACRRHQRLVAVAIKRAREMALLPYIANDGPPERARPSENR